MYYIKGVKIQCISRVQSTNYNHSKVELVESVGTSGGDHGHRHTMSVP